MKWIIVYAPHEGGISRYGPFDTRKAAVEALNGRGQDECHDRGSGRTSDPATRQASGPKVEPYGLESPTDPLGDSFVPISIEGGAIHLAGVFLYRIF